MGTENAAIVTAAEELVQQVMGAWDSSHDPFHALRVRDLALSLAAQEGLQPPSLLIVELAALFTILVMPLAIFCSSNLATVSLYAFSKILETKKSSMYFNRADDHKYATSGDNLDNRAHRFLKEQGVGSEMAEAIMGIISSIGFKEELGGIQNGQLSPEFGVVQDADRLDAIGAIGIARAFTFGGSRNRVMHDPAQKPRTSLSKTQYVSGDANPTTINHFHEKLLKLKDLMKSKAGKQRAEERHKFMEAFLQQFQGEWEGQL